jgi:hypothetical protein
MPMPVNDQYDDDDDDQFEFDFGENSDPSSSPAPASPVPSPSPSGPARPSSVPVDDYIFDRIPDLVEVLGTLQDDGDSVSSSPISETGNDATIPV